MDSKVLHINGVPYLVEVSHDGDIIEVRDSSGLIASAEKDHAVEAVIYDYHNQEEGILEGFSGSISDLFNNSPEEIAIWLVNTHPEA